MHRSGTSLLAGILHNCGIIMGTDKTFIPKPNRENPKGFFENIEFRKINDSILNFSGYKVKQWNPKVPDIKCNKLHRFRIKKSIASYSNKYEIWGWKDPRQMLTMQLWIEAIEELKMLGNLKIIFIYRNPISVATSMLKRGNTETLSHGLALWFIYNRICLNSLEENKLSFFVCSFEQIIESPSLVFGNLSNFLSFHLDRDKIGDFLSLNLVRSSCENELEIMENFFDNKITDLFKKLSNLNGAKL
jgi:hypothetical protein